MNMFVIQYRDMITGKEYVRFTTKEREVPVMEKVLNGSKINTYNWKKGTPNFESDIEMKELSKHLDDLVKRKKLPNDWHIWMYKFINSTRGIRLLKEAV